MTAGESFVQDWVVFVIEWTDNERRYLTSTRSHGNGERPLLSSYTNFHTTREFEAAGVMRGTDIEDIVDVYNRARDEYPNGSVEVYAVNIDVTFEPINLGEGEYLEKRRKRAIEKLTQDDIEVLNLGKFLVYDKLKNYKVDGLDL